MQLAGFEEGLRHRRKQTEIDPSGALDPDTLAVGYLQCNRLPEALDASRGHRRRHRGAHSSGEAHAIIARRAGAQSDYEHAVAAVKALLNLPEYDKFEVSSTKLSIGVRFESQRQTNRRTYLGGTLSATRIPIFLSTDQPVLA